LNSFEVERIDSAENADYAVSSRFLYRTRTYLTKKIIIIINVIVHILMTMIVSGALVVVQVLDPSISTLIVAQQLPYSYISLAQIERHVSSDNPGSTRQTIQVASRTAASVTHPGSITYSGLRHSSR